LKIDRLNEDFFQSFFKRFEVSKKHYIYIYILKRLCVQINIKFASLDSRSLWRKQMNREEKLTGDWTKEIHLKIHKEIKYFLNDLIVTSLIV